MKKVLASILVLLLAVPISAPAFEWPSVAEKALQSVVSLESNGRLQCTAFSINESRRLFMTAAHCNGENLTLGGEIAWSVYFNEAEDIMVLQSEGIVKPALKPGKLPKVGQDIASIGFGYGFKEPMFRTGRVSKVQAPFDDIGEFMETDFSIIGGMSGGPMIDQDGKVIAINQRGNMQISLGKNIRQILELTRQYWA